MTLSLSRPAGALALALCAASGLPVRAQPAPPATLYIGGIQSQGYVVGGALKGSGLQRYDGGSTWTHLGWNTPRVVGVAVDPARPDTVYLASGNGVLRTYDAGRSWRVTTDWRVTEVQDVAVDPHDPAHVYLASGYGVWRSEDHGDTWAEANAGLPPPGNTYTETIEADHVRPGRLLVGTQDGVYVSSDGARSWRRVGGAGLEVLDLNQSASEPDRWIAATQGHGLLLSSDNGETWRPGPRALARHTVHAVAIDPFDADRMAAVGWDTGVYLSENGGRSWRRRGDSLPTDRFYEAVYDANVPGRLWVATLEEGVFTTDDQGRTWRPQGLDGTLVFDMFFAPPSASAAR
jgi:photosystem II stability/assembly factor-like uncharacterized protein